MLKPARPKDFLAPVLLWAMILVGGLVGQAKPAAGPIMIACAR